ncbi:MAG TPA: hypothetical protein VK658_25975 [Chryseolinea sp.]|nr:hypothetical protein [Chryseolinea sp.]
MKNSTLCLLPVLLFAVTDIPAQVGLEQYLYLKNRKVETLVPIITYESPHIYVEARYNYEENNTFSIYLGRSVSGKNKCEYSITPMIGFAMGQFSGVAAGANATLAYQNIFFTTQIQYARSFHEVRDDFAFAWTDLTYQPATWIYVGLSTQQTVMPRASTFLSEQGIVVGFSIERWTFPMYYFMPIHEDQYFVLGINYNVHTSKRNK